MSNTGRIVFLLFCAVLLPIAYSATIMVNDSVGPCIGGFDSYNTTIANAITSASPGDTVIVCPKNGVYVETSPPIRIDKSLNVYGFYNASLGGYPNVSGGGATSVFSINDTASVNLSNFTVRDAYDTIGTTLAGVYILRSSNVIVSNVTAINNTYGFLLSSSASNTLVNNTAEESLRYDLYLIPNSASDCDNSISALIGSGGRPINFTNNSVTWSNVVSSEIFLCDADESTLTNVTIRGSDRSSNNALVLYYTDNAMINDSNSSHNYIGIELNYAHENTLKSNIINNNSAAGYGMLLTSSLFNVLLDNAVLDNTLLITGSNFTNVTNNSFQGTSIAVTITVNGVGSRVVNNSLFNGTYSIATSVTVINNTANRGGFSAGGSNITFLSNVAVVSTISGASGFSISGGSNITVINNTAINATNGLGFLITSNLSLFDNNTAIQNSVGFRLGGEGGSNFTNNIANNNSNVGIWLTSSTLPYRIINNTAKDNSLFDFLVDPNSDASCNHIVQNLTGSGDRPINFTNNSVSWSNFVASEVILCNADQSNITNATVIGSASFNNGFILLRTNSTSIANSSSYHNYYGFYVNASSDWNNLSHVRAYDNRINVYVQSSSNNSLTNVTSYNSSAGVYVRDAGDSRLTDNHYYNNTLDFVVNSSSSAFRINLSGVIFDNPGGTLQNYTNISVNDIVSGSSSYSIVWSVQPASLPADFVTFSEKYINITNNSGTVSIDSITWHWSDSEAGTQNESRFALYKYNSSWNAMNLTPNASANILSLSNLNVFSTFALLENASSLFRLTACGILSNPGNYTLTANLSGAPNSASPLSGTACIKINVSEVTVNCAGYNISNNGTSGTTYGVLLSTVVNTIVRDCFSVSLYTFGLYSSQSNGANISNTTSNNNTRTGFVLSNSQNNTLDGVTAYNNSESGVDITAGSNNNILINLNASVNGVYGILLNASNFTLLANSTAASDYSAWFGFQLLSAYSNNLTNNTATGNQVGFNLSFSAFNILLNNKGISNAANGFSVLSSTSNNLTGNNATSNNIGFALYSSNSSNFTNNIGGSNGYGFYIFPSSYYNNFTNNSANGNTLYGFYLDSTHSNNFTGNIAENNSDFIANNVGFFLISSENNTFTSNTANNNGDPIIFSLAGCGFCLTSSNSNTFTNNTASDNYGISIAYGFYLTSSNSNTFTNNTANGNPSVTSSYGFYLTSSNSNTLSNGTAINNTIYGFYLTGSSSNNLSSNTLNNNSQSGIYITGSSSDNRIFSNTIYNHTQGLASGIFFQGINTTNYIYSNPVIENNTYGIYINESNLTNITDNVITNSQYGFYFDRSWLTNLSGNNATNSSIVQYQFSNSNATLTGPNYAYQTPGTAFDLNISTGNTLAGNSNNFTTDHMTIAFSTLENLSVKTSFLSDTSVSATQCASNAFSSCQLVSELLNLTNISGPGRVTDIAVYYNISKITGAMAETNTYIGDWGDTGWTQTGRTALDTATHSVSYSPLTRFSYQGAVVFSTPVISSSGESEKELHLDYQFLCPGGSLQVWALSDTAGVGSIPITLYNSVTTETIDSQTTNADGRAAFNVSPGSYTLVQSEKKNGYLKANRVRLDISACEQEFREFSVELLPVCPTNHLLVDVRDKTNGNSLSDVQITVVDNTDGSQQSYNTLQGKAETGLLKEVPYEFVLVKDGYYTEKIPVHFGQGIYACPNYEIEFFCRQSEFVVRILETTARNPLAYAGILLRPVSEFNTSNLTTYAIKVTPPSNVYPVKTKNIPALECLSDIAGDTYLTTNEVGEAVFQVPKPPSCEIYTQEHVDVGNSVTAQLRCNGNFMSGKLLQIQDPNGSIFTQTTDANGAIAFPASNKGDYTISLIDPELVTNNKTVQSAAALSEPELSGPAILILPDEPWCLPFLLLLILVILILYYYYRRRREEEEEKNARYSNPQR